MLSLAETRYRPAVSEPVSTVSDERLRREQNLFLSRKVSSVVATSRRLECLGPPAASPVLRGSLGAEPQRLRETDRLCVGAQLERVIHRPRQRAVWARSPVRTRFRRPGEQRAIECGERLVLE